MRNGKKSLRQVLCKLDHEQTFPLLELPPEIRLKIYEQILHPKVAAQRYIVDGKVVHRPKRPMKEPTIYRNTAIFRVSKQVSQEALHYWYQQKTFRVLITSRYSFGGNSYAPTQSTDCFADAVKGMVVCSHQTRSAGCPTILSHFHDSLMGRGPAFGPLHKIRHLFVELRLQTKGSGAPPAAEVWARANRIIFCLANAIMRSDSIEDVTIGISERAAACTDEALKLILFPLALISRLDGHCPSVLFVGLPERMHAWLGQHSMNFKLREILQDHDRIRVEGYQMVEDIKALLTTPEGRNLIWAIKQIESKFVMDGWAEVIKNISLAGEQGFELMSDFTKALRRMLDYMKAIIANPDLGGLRTSIDGVGDEHQDPSRVAGLGGEQSARTARKRQT